jgi:hypothetical protein
MNFGWRAISPRLRPDEVCSAAVGAGIWMKRSSTTVTSAKKMSEA